MKNFLSDKVFSDKPLWYDLLEFLSLGAKEKLEQLKQKDKLKSIPKLLQRESKKVP
jgi:hypothetical protein